MTYQPFLPEVAAGSIEARHAVVPLRRHLRRTRIVSGRATEIDHAARTVHVRLADGTTTAIAYDEVVVTAGAVTRVFPVPGVADAAIGMKHIEEAVAIRDAVLTAFDEAASLPPGPERQRRLTVTFIGGGFAGVEGFGEVLSLARAPPAPPRHRARGARLPPRRRQRPHPSRGHAPRRAWVRRHLERRGATVHLSTTVTSVVDGRVRLSTGETFDSGLVVWTAGIAANPVVAATPTCRSTIAASSWCDPTCGSAPPSAGRARLGGRRRRRRPRPRGRARPLHRAQCPARRPPGQAAGEEPGRRAARSRSPSRTGTATSARWPRSAWATASSSRARSP